MQNPHLHRASIHAVPRGVALNLLASALTILSAIALLVVAATLGDASATVAGPQRHDRVVQEFYDAVNEAFRARDTRALDRVVAPDLAFYPPAASTAIDRAGLERYLAGIHDIFPTFQLRVDDIVSDADRAVARVAGGSDQPGRFLGLDLAAAPAPWGQFDSFRIVDRRIVEIRAGEPAPVRFEVAAAVELVLETAPQAASFERLSAAVGERRAWGPFSGPRVLYVAEGAIAVDLNPTEPQGPNAVRNGLAPQTEAAVGMPMVMTAGAVMSFAPGSRFLVRRAAADAGVTAFTVALPRYPYVGPHQPQDDNEEQDAPDVFQLAPGWAHVFDPRAGVTVAFGRALLPPGSTVAFAEADGFLFAAVESGALLLANEREVVSLNHPGADGLGMVEPGEPFALHNLGDADATVVMVALLPRRAHAAPLAPAATPNRIGAVAVHRFDAATSVRFGGQSRAAGPETPPAASVAPRLAGAMPPPGVGGAFDGPAAFLAGAAALARRQDATAAARASGTARREEVGRQARRWSGGLPDCGDVAAAKVPCRP